MKLLKTIFVTLLLLLLSTYTAKVVRVSDGDTIFEVFMTLERDGFDKVEMLDDKKKLDLYIGYMVRLI